MVIGWAVPPWGARIRERLFLQLSDKDRRTISTSAHFKLRFGITGLRSGRGVLACTPLFDDLILIDSTITIAVSTIHMRPGVQSAWSWAAVGIAEMRYHPGNFFVLK